MSLIVGVRQKCNFHCPNQLSECQYLCISLINITASLSGQNIHTHTYTQKETNNDNWRNFNMESLVRHLNPSAGEKIENWISTQLSICSGVQ